jgi:hypothetical protein
VWVAVAVFASTASAAGALSWHRLASNPPNDAKVKTLTAYLAADRSSARAFSSELTYGDPARLARVDFGKNLVVAVFDAPACTPHLPVVDSLSQNGRLLVVALQGEPPSAAGCSRKWPGGYELVTVQKASLRTPYPTRAVARYR